MYWCNRTFLVIVAVFTTLSVVSLAHAKAKKTYYPDDGKFWYDGRHYAESYLLWNNPGGWSKKGKKSDPGYEHDLALNPDYFHACTTWTNLPSGYDDCPTAGVLEPGDFWAFSFGSFHAKKIKPKTWYMGTWRFSGGDSPPTKFYLSGQEVYHKICPLDSIWCMEGVRSNPLTNGNLIWGQSLSRSW